jgi:hypothetical protein
MYLSDKLVSDVLHVPVPRSSAEDLDEVLEQCFSSVPAVAHFWVKLEPEELAVLARNRGVVGVAGVCDLQKSFRKSSNLKKINFQEKTEKTEKN